MLLWRTSTRPLTFCRGLAASRQRSPCPRRRHSFGAGGNAVPCIDELRHRLAEFFDPTGLGSVNKEWVASQDVYSRIEEFLRREVAALPIRQQSTDDLYVLLRHRPLRISRNVARPMRSSPRPRRRYPTAACNARGARVRPPASSASRRVLDSAPRLAEAMVRNSCWRLGGHQNQVSQAPASRASPSDRSLAARRIRRPLRRRRQSRAPATCPPMWTCPRRTFR